MSALRDFDKVEVNFDGVAGFAYSFLEEAFGGLIQKEGMDKNFLDTRLFFLRPSRALRAISGWRSTALRWRTRDNEHQLDHRSYVASRDPLRRRNCLVRELPVQHRIYRHIRLI